jgi:predicted ArsR family transcriptional regulator
MRIDRASPWTYARWFQALADPSRAIICNLLADAGRPMTVGEMVQAIEIGQSTVSHHLKLLAEVGFVQASPKGTAASTGSTPGAWRPSRPRPSSSWAAYKPAWTVLTFVDQSGKLMHRRTSI